MVILSLFDYTGHALEPWAQAGHTCIAVDIQHTDALLPRYIKPGTIYKVNWDCTNATYIKRKLANARPDLILGWPPCTDLAVSGARWFKTKAAINPDFQQEAVDRARAVEHLANSYNPRVPYAIENPVGRLSTLWRKPDYWFHPYEFTGYCREDNYTKKTGTWCGNGFVRPEVYRDESLPPPDDRIHKAPPSKERANFRSATPKGYAQAVYKANKPLIPDCGSWEEMSNFFC